MIFLAMMNVMLLLMHQKESLSHQQLLAQISIFNMKGRTSENCWIEHSANDIVHEVSKRFSILVQMPIRNAEQYQLVYYKKGAQYKPHFDSFDYETADGKKNWEPGGQRMITVIAYLNDVEEGGETGFPELGINIPPNKGDAVVFIILYR